MRRLSHHLHRCRLGAYSALALGLVTLSGAAAAQHHEEPMCGDTPHPILTVADFNGDGQVSAADVKDVAQTVEAGVYYALYDRNADGTLSDEDIRQTAMDLGKASSSYDQGRASIYQRYRHYQTARGIPELMALGYTPFPAPLAGHGAHWLSEVGFGTVLGLRPSTPELGDGLNVPYAGDKPWAMFWGEAADPVFEGGATDYPWGEEWKTQRVIAFGDAPPNFTGDPDEMWHTHAGLCIQFTPDDSPYGVKTTFHQHTTWAECQAYDSVVKLPDGSNMWLNIWMLHMWLFELNPAGFYGGTHPCIDPWAPSESSINDGRAVPDYFAHHH